MTQDRSGDNDPEGKPITHHINLEQALGDLDYGDMVRLRRLYEQWALSGELAPDQATKMMLWSADHEAIAKYCGILWRASSPRPKGSFTRWVARNAFPIRANDRSNPLARAATLQSEDSVGPVLLQVATVPAEVVPENAESMLDDLAGRMKIIIEDDEDPEGLMAEIMVCAEEAGLHDEAWCVRTSSPWVFTLDLIHDNPQAHDWMQDTLIFSQIRLEGVIDRNSLLDVLVRPA